MPKRAFMVLGPESSDTRFFTRCLIKAGCVGDGGHRQAFDHLPAAGEPDILSTARRPIVWRRSLPHGGGANRRWPDLESMLARLRRNEFDDVRVFALTRLQYCMARSQVSHHLDHLGALQKMSTAERNILEATYRIAKFALDNQLPVQYVTYEAVVHNFTLVRRALADWGLDLAGPPEKIVDGNRKYARRARR